MYIFPANSCTDLIRTQYGLNTRKGRNGILMKFNDFIVYHNWQV
jgi:hypothetical protein